MSAKSKETTKTAHVMNLLRKNSINPQTADPASAQEPDMEQNEAVAVQPETQPVQHPIIASLNEEAVVSQEIKDALEMELSIDEPPMLAAEPEPEPVWDEEPEEEVLLEEAGEETVDASDFPQEQEEVPAEEETEPEANLPVEEEEPRVPRVKIYNAMQMLVEENTEKYMTMFKLCTCPRCRADVQAIALNNLQPKYVVMEEGELIPRITVYERQFHTTITAQILRACTIVAAHPHHNR